MTRDSTPLGAARSREQQVGDAHVALFADDLRVRLRHVCCDWDDDEFEALVQHIARMKVRWSVLDRAD